MSTTVAKEMLAHPRTVKARWLSVRIKSNDSIRACKCQSVTSVVVRQTELAAGNRRSGQKNVKYATSSNKTSGKPDAKKGAVSTWMNSIDTKQHEVLKSPYDKGTFPEKGTVSATPPASNTPEKDPISVSQPYLTMN